MKLRRRPLPLSLLLLQISVATEPAITLGTTNVKALENVQDRAEGKVIIETPSATSTSTAPLVKQTSGASFGSSDAPFDGKDGRPHAGPFVETAAERDRKKAKGNGDDDLPSVTKKPPPSDLKEGPSFKEGWDKEPMPLSNDGVMDDPNRLGPKEGTRGTEGGVSEKSRDRKAQENQIGGKSEKKPDAPKEAPPLPHSEQEQIDLEQTELPATNPKTLSDESAAKIEKPDDDGIVRTVKEVGGLEKPIDLPQKPHDIPHTLPPSTPSDPLAIAKPPPLTSYPITAAPATLIEPLHSFVLSLTMILFSEIGDKTFLIAALMAMKYPRLQVFSAAMSALLLMTVGSAIFGHAVPTLIPKRLTNFAAAGLFLVFGVKMLREGLSIPRSMGVTEEMREVESELEEKEALAARELQRRRSSAAVTPYMLEGGRGIPARGKSRGASRLPSPPESPPDSPSSPTMGPQSSGIGGALAGVSNLFSLLLSPAWVQTFVMTFLGEWGDRSQIATIAMAAGQDYWWVTAGAVFGHMCCTTVAVVGGRAIAGRVSLRVGKLLYSYSFSPSNLARSYLAT